MSAADPATGIVEPGECFAIDRDLATRIIDATFAAAASHALTRLAIVVTDAGGDIRAAMRSDTGPGFGIDIAHAKAKSAIGFRKSTLQLAVHFGKNPSSTIGVTAATGQRFVPIGGGVVVFDRRGLVLGAVAVAGGMPEVDDAVARDGLLAVGLEAAP